MLIPLLRLLLSFAHVPSEHEIAHRICETTVYAIVSPDVADDSVTLVGEVDSDILCREDAS